MPFKYIIKWRRKHPEKVTVEAYHRYPKTEEEKTKPAFTIGQAEGSPVLAIRHVLEKAAQKNPTKKHGSATHILIDESEPAAYESAYRIGLAAALLNKAQTSTEIEKGTKYILNATPEEIWFWTSKWLDEDLNERALQALAVMSGSINLANFGYQREPMPPSKLEPKENLQSLSQEKPEGSFWPLVRQRMQEKAMQLYTKDHPDKTNPSLKELRKTGYLQTAKAIALKEIYMEKKARASDQHCPPSEAT
jgi:hypothetical protein